MSRTLSTCSSTRRSASCSSFSSTGHGFRVKVSECVATKRTGKQVLNVSEGAEAAVCVPVTGDMIAIIGENRKLLLFRLRRFRKCRAARA